MAGFLILGATLRAAAADDIVVADFEGDTYGAWQVSGDAFGAGPARGALPGQMSVDGFKGRGLVNTFLKGDGSTGTLRSPEFTLERKYLAFLIGGGRDEARLALRLWVDGKVVRSTTGSNSQPGGSETLTPESWDVSDLSGRRAILEVVDQATGGWGHINVDHIVLTDRKPAAPRINPSRKIEVTQRYLHLPVKLGAPKRVVTLRADGRDIVRNDVELALSDPEWWAPMDLGAWIGKTVELQVDKLPDDSTLLESLVLEPGIRDSATLYREPLRGQLHFSPRRGWNNDPNGLVYFNGEYHLFFQHNPYGWGWGNMHWGHAVSRDLVRWTELGDVLAPDALGPMFSGSAVVDWNNTSGLGSAGKPPLVLLYTAAGSPTVQCLASSVDGRQFHKYPGNPIIPEFTGGNRDPKVIWHEPTKRWVMTLYVETNRVHTIQFLTSPNLRDWTVRSRVDGFFECPDLFELPIDGDATRKKWVLTAASSEYRVGTFDGEVFTPETPKLPGHRGKGFYAAQTFSDIPATDGRRIQVGWFQTETRGMAFNQSMTIPLELRLVSTMEGPRLAWHPAKELETLRRQDSSVVRGPQELKPGMANPLENVQGELLEIRAEFEPGTASAIELDVRGIPVVYSVADQSWTIQKHRAPAPLRGGRQRLVLYCDRTGLEVFGSDGLTYIPLPVQPDPAAKSIAIRSVGGVAQVQRLEAHVLKSIWE